MSTDATTQTARQTILAVDDDPGNLGVLRRLLHSQYNVLAAPSGERALAIAAGEPKPDLILLDVMMPGMDGYAVLAQLRDNPATRHIPVIFVTGLDSIEDEEKGLALGAVDYIAKPYRPPIMLARVQIHLELKRARDWLRDQNVFLEAEVARREQTLHSVTDAARDAIIMVDGEGRIAFWNPAAEKMFGYTATEVLGRELHALLVPPRYRKAIDHGFAGFKESGTGGAVGKTTELAALRKDGTEFPMEISLAAVRRDNAWWGVGTVRDITARKALDDKLAQAQAHLLQSDKLAAIGQLAAGVAHEINNPIGFVSSNMGTLEYYIRELFEILDAYAGLEEVSAANETALAAVQELKQQKNLDFLRGDIKQLMAESQDGLQRVRKIVADLKSFSHVDDVNWKWADLQSGLESTLNMVWNELKYHCTVHKEYGELPEVWCLPSQLNQVFMNLLVNAGQAIADKGDITIRTGRRGEEVFVAIADTGSGISPEDQRRLFEPFFTTKPVGKGTGLGLSLAFSIVHKHGGRIEVDSTVGKGTTFTVWLPVAPQAETAATTGS
ncbi:MAG: response regulator [Sulfuritalea sp.]|jgi:PAS domain S-box-containing protein|nr:response regulator [Sulfuritalea sp.]